MGEFTIEQVVETGEAYEFKDMRLVPYELLLKGDNQTVTLNQKDDTQPPTPGQVLDGEIVSGKNGRRFKKAFADGGSNSAGGGDGGKFDRRPEHPSNERRMRHSTALSNAPAVIDQMLTIGVVPQPKDKDEYVKLYEGVVTWIESTYAPAELS